MDPDLGRLPRLLSKPFAASVGVDSGSGCGAGRRFHACGALADEGRRLPNPHILPFLDGNGRVGRLLIILQLCERGILPAPLLYLSAFFEATRTDYYAGLRAVSENGDWEGWVQYFLNGVARQSEDALSRAEQINHLLGDWRKKLSGQVGTKVALRMVDMIGANPFLTPRGAKDKLDIAYNTSMRAIGQLEKMRILEEVGEAKRDRVYCAKAIMDILEEPARLMPV
jgi:Fic family protein